MSHYKLMYPSEYLQACDLAGKEPSVTIEKVVMEEVPDPQGKKKLKPVMHFAGAKKRFPLPKTCAKFVAERYGNDTEQWVGKKVTLFATTCTAFGNTVECIRFK